MSLRFERFLVALAVSVWSVAGDAREPQTAEFQPNYVASVAVQLSTPGGRPAGQLAAGTQVTGKSVLEGVLSVTTSDGKTGLASASDFSRLRSSIEVTPACRDAATSSNRLAIDLYQQTRGRKGNLFFSPASISTALAMTWAGAAGTTRQQMAQVMHLETSEAVNAGFADLSQVLNSTDDRNGYQMTSANRLWGAMDTQFESSFLSVMKETYHAPLERLSFSQPETARTRINEWVQTQTRGRIAGLVPPGVLKSSDRLVLTNAIYFLGGWAAVFNKSQTKPDSFWVSLTDSVETPMMYQQHSFLYAEDEQCQIVSLPYRGRSVSMVVVLPKSRDGLSRLEEGLTQELLETWIQRMVDRPVKLHLPRMRMESQLMLADVLKSLGMSEALSDSADFSAMSKQESLKISEVIHQANIDVDEKGTEAAAATAVIIAPTSAPAPTEPPEPVVFRANHPFLFLIRDNPSGAILFLGRMQQPPRVTAEKTE